MKKLNECKEYFKDVHKEYLQYRDQDSRVRYNTMCETMEFIYPEFKNVCLNWIQESLNEYYAR